MNRIEQLYNEWQSLLPLKPEDQSRLDRKFMLEFNYNSNHIEGNTLTYGQTELLLLFGKVVDEANMKDLEEMKAHNVCLKMMQTEAAEKDKPLTETFIRQLHRTMLREDYVCYRRLPDGTNTSYTVYAGVYKTRPNSVITVTGERFEYASPEETPALMADLLNWYNEAEAKAELSPIELASVFHYRYIRIHPFEDGNGRIARLMVNYILARHNYPMIVVKSKDKSRYLTALHQADTFTGKMPADGAFADKEAIKPFTDYMKQLLCGELSDNISFVKEKADMIWWYNGAFVKFANENTVKLIKVLFDAPAITVRELSERLPINKSAVQKQLKALQDKGYIVRLGGARGGYWHVALVCTTSKSGQIINGGQIK